MIKTHSAGGVVVNQEGKILLVSQHGKSWSFPKGHMNEDEDELTCAKREIKEESGVTELKLIKKLGSFYRYKIGQNFGEDKGELKKITLFLFKTNQMELKPIDPDNPEARWIDINNTQQMLSNKKDKKFFEKIKEKI